VDFDRLDYLGRSRAHDQIEQPASTEAVGAGAGDVEAGSGAD